MLGEGDEDDGVFEGAEPLVAGAGELALLPELGEEIVGEGEDEGGGGVGVVVAAQDGAAIDDVEDGGADTPEEDGVPGGERAEGAAAEDGGGIGEEGAGDAFGEGGRGGRRGSGGGIGGWWHVGEDNDE